MALKKFSVISSGMVLPDFDRQKVVAELAELLNIPEEIIGASLLNESSRKLQSVDSRLAAESLVSKFKALGLKCSIVENSQTARQLNNLADDSAPVDADNNQSRGGSKWYAAMILLGAIAYVLVFFVIR